VLKRKKETEEKRDKPEPDKRFKFFNPVTGQEHEGTAESARLCATRYLACLRDDGADVVVARFGTAPWYLAMLAASNCIFEIGIGEKTVEAPLVLESYHILRGWAQVHDVMCFLQRFFFRTEKLIMFTPR